MGQQPNIEIEDSDRPRPTAQPAPARRWRPVKAGLITTPAEKPHGEGFGHPGPDHGWAQVVIDGFDLPDDDPDLVAVVTGLTQARAAAFGRAPVREDVEVALVLCGYWEDAPEWLLDRRRAWLAASAHEKRPGKTAVAQVGPDLLRMKPADIRYAIRRG